MSDIWQCDTHGCDYETESKRGLSIHKSASHNGSGSAKKTYMCANCGSTFEDYPSRREGRGRKTFFCKRECKYEHESDDTVERDCANCGTTLILPEYRLKDSTDGYSIDNHFCNKRCESEWKTSNWVGENHPSWGGGLVELTCEECGDTYEVKPSLVDTSRYCKMECKRAAWADDPIEFECSICGADFSLQPCRVRSEAPTCSKRCFRKLLSELRKGENNPAWDGGKETYYGSNWNRQRRAALERDGFECQLCGMSGSEHREQYSKQLHVHHITRLKSFEDDYEVANNLENLVTLCLVCHKGMEPEPADKQREMLAVV